MPEISFLIPVYNVEKYLPQCLDSIALQTFQDWECLLVDDGSSDSSGSICDSYEKADARFRTIHTQNAGASSARNTALENARGDWIYYVDSDDWLEPDAAQIVLDAAKESKADCIMSYALRHLENGATIRGKLFSQAFTADTRESIGLMQKYVLYRPYSPYYCAEAVSGYAAPWSKFVKRQLLVENNVAFDTDVFDIFEDGLWTLNVFEHAKKICYIDKQTYHYRVLENSLIHSFKEDSMRIQEAGYAKIEAFLQTHHKDKTFWEAYYAHVVSFFGGYLSRYFYHPDRNKSKREIDREIKRYLNREPYRTAAQNVDMAMLLKKDAYLAFCQKHRFVLGLRLYCAARNNYRKRVAE